MSYARFHWRACNLPRRVCRQGPSAALVRGALAAIVAAACARSTPAASRPAAPVPAAPAPAGYTQGDLVPAHDTFSVRSVALGEPRRVNVYLPPQYRAAPRGARLPVLYMPDGGVDEDFAHVANTVDSLISRGAIRPVLVVGIPNTERRRDLTGPTHLAADSAIAPRVGGSAAFRRFLREELVPEVERRYRVTGERGIVGESLAGLFVLETFLEEPELFEHYVAVDPSLWWDGGALVASARARLAAVGRPAAPRTLYLASSGEERGTGSARLSQVLRAASPAGLRWTFDPRPDLTHATIFRAVKPRALAEALR